MLKKLHMWYAKWMLTFTMWTSPSEMTASYYEMTNLYMQVIDALEHGADVIISHADFMEAQAPKKDRSHLSIIDGEKKEVEPETEFGHKYGKEEKEVQPSGNDNQSAEEPVTETPPEKGS